MSKEEQLCARLENVLQILGKALTDVADLPTADASSLGRATDILLDAIDAAAREAAGLNK